MLMMTKKRTAAIANAKLLVVIPIVTIVFLAVSAYREIPLATEKESPVTSNYQALPPPPPPPVPSDMKYKAEKSDPKEEYAFVAVEEMPMYPGGDAELLKFIGENTRYPQSAKNANIQGKVIVRFCVTSKGGVSMISVLKGISPDLDAEAIRVVSTISNFRPGRQGGKPVPVWYMVPIAFTLK
jgi:TonB family protein